MPRPSNDVVAPIRLRSPQRAAPRALLFLLWMAAMACGISLPHAARAEEQPRREPAIEQRLQALIPALESHIAAGMKALDSPGLAMGIVADDRLVYAKGFGVRSKAGGAPVDSRTVFQIGSTTKAFLTTTMAIMVDRGKLRWDDRVVDLDPEFQLKDPGSRASFASSTCRSALRASTLRQRHACLC